MHAEHWPLRQRRNMNGRLTGAQHRHPRAGLARALGCLDQGPAPAYSGVHGWFRGQPLDPGGGPVAPQVCPGGLLRRGEQHLVAVHAGHGAQLQAGWGDGGAVHGQVPGAGQVGVAEQPAGGAARWQPGHQLHPAVVVLLVQDRGLATGRADPEEPDRALVAGLHDRVGTVAVPAGPHQVLERDPVPPDRGPRPVGPGDPQRDIGVGLAGCRVTQGARRLPRLRRAGQVPQFHRRAVHPGGQQPVTARRPPVPAWPLQ